MLQSSLTDQTSFEVRFSAVKACVNFLLLHEKDNTVLKHFADLLDPLLTVIT